MFKIRIQHPELGVFVSDSMEQNEIEDVHKTVRSAASGKMTYISFLDVSGNEHFFSENILKNSIISLLSDQKQ